MFAPAVTAIQASLLAIASVGLAVLLVLVALRVFRWASSLLDDESPLHDFDPDFDDLDALDGGWQCTNCNSMVSGDTVICHDCGQPYMAEELEYDYSLLDERFCPNCETETDPDQGRCYNCGLAWGDGS